MTQPLDLSNKQWNKFCDFGMSDPVALDEADLTKPFVYERQYGVFYVPGGMHPSSMSLLLAIQHGCDDGIAVAVKLKLNYSCGTAEHWLKRTPGAAFRSSVGKHIMVATDREMTPLERRLFGVVTSVFTDAEMAC